jgi:hypothetical protein
MIEMMKSYLRVSIAGFVSLLLFGCLASAPKPISPLNSPLATLTPLYRIYTDTFSLRDGRSLPLRCVDAGNPFEIECTAIFPNGNKMPNATDQIVYSPDGKFAIRPCVRSTHDSSCLDGHQVWDMTNGIELHDFHMSWAWSHWVPDEPHVLAYIDDRQDLGEDLVLVFWDVATGHVTYPSQCPSWIIPIRHPLTKTVCSQNPDPSFLTPAH